MYSCTRWHLGYLRPQDRNPVLLKEWPVYVQSYFETGTQQLRARDSIKREAWLGPTENLDLYEASRYVQTRDRESRRRCHAPPDDHVRDRPKASNPPEQWRRAAI